MWHNSQVVKRYHLGDNFPPYEWTLCSGFFIVKVSIDSLDSWPETWKEKIVFSAKSLTITCVWERHCPRYGSRNEGSTSCSSEYRITGWRVLRRSQFLWFLPYCWNCTRVALYIMVRKYRPSSMAVFWDLSIYFEHNMTIYQIRDTFLHQSWLTVKVVK